jgi:2-polyprenyl-3-methyl-5-hydroxy-6-metoxy-1,4-benzoquinol methylase
MLQPLKELEFFYANEDPWGYETNSDDIKRRNIILSEIPERNYDNVLDIGCGHGFVTRELPGKKITGIDISVNAITQANSYQSKLNKTKQINFIQASIFDFDSHDYGIYDLIIITGVLYPQYIGQAKSIIYKIIDKHLATDGYLICCHINEWYKLRFPYLMLENYYFEYREYTQCLEVYVK